MSDREWEEAIGGASPAMHAYVEAMNKDLEGSSLKRDCSNLAHIKAVALNKSFGADLRGNFDEIPGETLGHKLVFLAAPTRGEIAFFLTADDGTTANIFMTDDPKTRAKLKAKLEGRLN